MYKTFDKKGRISLPSSFRALLDRENKVQLVLFKSFKYPSIEGCGYKHIENIAKRIDQLDTFSDDQDDFTTSIFSELKPIQILPAICEQMDSSSDIHIHRDGFSLLSFADVFREAISPRVRLELAAVEESSPATLTIVTGDLCFK